MAPFGARGQKTLQEAALTVWGDDLAAEVCALYLAGAGCGMVRVSPNLSEDCGSLNRDILVVPHDPRDRADDGVMVELEWNRRSAALRRMDLEADSTILLGSMAARWAIATLMTWARVE